MALRPPNRYTAIVNPRYTEAERRRIGEAIIRFIQERTMKGKGIGGQTFRNSSGRAVYSQNYVETREFQISGKSRSRINLSLTGDMLDSIEVVDVSTMGRVVIGIPDDQENDKSVFMREKGYDFLGLSNDELRGILQKIGEPSTQRETEEIDSSLLQSLVRNILRGQS